MASARRIEKIQNLIREVVAGIMNRELAFPAGTLVTVTRVEVSEDLFYGTVLVTILAGSPEGERAALGQLEDATGALQHTLNRKLRMRPVPRITFAVDRGEQRRERIERLLNDKT